MKVFVTKYNFTGFVPDQNSYNGLTLKRDQIGNPRRLEEMTLCFRVNLEYFLLMGQHSPLLDLLDGGGWEGGVNVEEDKLRLLEFYIKDPIENLHRLRIKTFTDKIVEAREAGNRNWHWPKFEKPANIKEWNHFCIGYSATTKKLILMHNGKVEVEHVRPELVNEVDDFIPSQWLGRMEDGSKKEGKYLTRKGILVLKKENVQGSLPTLIFGTLSCQRKICRNSHCAAKTLEAIFFHGMGKIGRCLRKLGWMSLRWLRGALIRFVHLQADFSSYKSESPGLRQSKCVASSRAN